MAISEKDRKALKEWVEKYGPIGCNTSPAVLLYFEDFLVGTSDLTLEELGQYILLLCLQNSKGHLSPELIERTIKKAGGADGVLPYVLAKFKKDDDGNYYNERMEFEIYRRIRRKKTLADNLEGSGSSKTKNTDWPEVTDADRYWLKSL